VTGARARGEAAKGTVVAFDEATGLGEVRLESGEVVGFHATQLQDGTRRVDVGRRVAVTVVPWHRGRLEAAAIVDEP